MSTLLLDTDVFSFLFKDHSLADAYRPHVKGHTLAISFMTVAELYQGAYRAGWGAKQIERLESRIAAYVVIPSSHAISKKWGEVRVMRRAQPISPEDAWVAAAALQQGYPLVTHNARDFQSIPGLSIVTESV